MMPNEKIAVIFPAFVTEFIGCETANLQSMGTDIHPYFQKASPVCGNEICSFDIEKRSFVFDELMIQYITYIYSCAVSDLLKEKNVHSDFVAGYSMGIYSALYHCGSLDYLDGLRIIQQAFRSISQTIPSGTYAMGLTGGLEKEDVASLMKKYAQHTYIINSNNRYTFVYSGPRSEIEALIQAAHEEGALMTRIMNVSIPYHSPYLENASVLLRRFLNDIPVRPPRERLVSSFNQQILSTEAGIKNELANNIFHPFHWYNTINCFLQQNTQTIIECGAGEGLTKINKFIPGDYRTYSLKNLSKWLTK